MTDRLGKADWMRAARRALLERGPEAVRVEPLARELGVTKGSFYWHFADRSELLEALLVEWEEETALLSDALRAASPRGELPAIIAELDRRNRASERAESPSDAAIFAWAASDPEVALRANRAEAERMRLFRALTGKKALADLFYYAYHGFLLRRRRVPSAADDFDSIARAALRIFGPEQKRRRRRPGRRVIAAGVAAVTFASLQGCTTLRTVRWRDPSAQSPLKIFAQRPVRAADEAFHFAVGAQRMDLDTVTVRAVDFRPQSFANYLASRQIKAFVVIRNDSIVYERYAGGYTDSTRSSSFSVAKSVTSALLGIALQNGAIHSLDDSVVRYLPELAGKPDFRGLTLRHLVEMKSGFAYSRTNGHAWHDLWSSDAHFYYTTKLHNSLAGQRREDEPGTRWAYKDSDAQLLAWVLERATGKTLAAQLEDGIWRRIGTERAASWDLDHRDGAENAASGLNATARDFARFGRLYLKNGVWNGERLLPAAWIAASTTLDSSRTEPEVATWWLMQHRSLWWIPMQNWSAEQDFFADGSRGQRIYVNRRLNTIIVQLADESAQDFPFRKVAHYLAGERYTYPRVVANQLAAAIAGGAGTDSVRVLYRALRERSGADPAAYSNSRAAMLGLVKRLESDGKREMAALLRSLADSTRAPTPRAAAPSTPIQAAATRTAIVAGRMLDVRAGAYRDSVVILIDGGRITDIRPLAGFGKTGETVIDLSNATVLPGLIDAHVHFALAGAPAANARATLRAGFTTVADLGSVKQQILRLRDSINAGTTSGPRILGAGLWIGRAGGICEFGGIGVRGDAEAYRARVRENVAAGADLIKVCVSTWLADAFEHPDRYEIAADALAATVEEAHLARRKVIAHDLSNAGVQAALAAGVDGFAHGAIVDSSVAAEMARRGTFMIPTLASLAASPGAAEEALRQSVSRLHRLGVRLVFGTDAGVIPHGANAREFAALVGAGLSPLDAIRAATINAAEALGISTDAGAIEVGRAADIVGVAGDPMTDVRVLERVQFVMKAGQVVR